MEETKVSNAPARWGKTRIVVTGGVGGIAGIVILGGALAVANMIKKVSSKNDANQDVPASEGGQGLRSLLQTCSSPECIHDDQDASGVTPDKIEDCCPEQETVGIPVSVVNSIQDDESSVDIAAEENFLDKQSKASVITNTIEENHHVPETPAKEDEKVSSDQGLSDDYKRGIEDESSRVIDDCRYIVDSPKEEDIPTVKVVVVVAEDKISTCEDLSSCNRIEHNVLINGYYTEMKQIETFQSEEDRSTNGVIIEICNTDTKQDAPTTIATGVGDYSPDPDTVETPIEEERSSMEVVVEENSSPREELFCCNGTTEHEASRTVIMTQIDDYYPQPETVETPIKEERLENGLDIKENDSTCEELFSCKSNEHDASTTTSTEADDYYRELEVVEILPTMATFQLTVEEESSHEEVKIEPENLGAGSARAAGDVIKDAKESVDIDESSVTCDCIKEETENEDGVLLKEDPSSPVKEETESEDDEDEEMEDSEGTPESSTESNSEAIWPVESKEEELLLSKDKAQVLEEKLYKETSQNVEEAGFVTMSLDMGTEMELRSRPSKIFSRGGFLVWLLLVVGLMFLFFASDLPISYHLNDPQLSSS